MKDMEEESNNKDLEEFLDKIGVPKNETSLKEIVCTITYNTDTRETIFVDQENKEIDFKSIVENDKYDNNFSFFKKGSLLTAKSHYSQVLNSNSQGNIPRGLTDLVDADKGKVYNPITSLRFNQQITVLEEGFIKILDDSSSQAESLFDSFKKEKPKKKEITKTIVLRYLKCLSMTTKSNWFDDETEMVTKPAILYIFFRKEVSRNFLISVLFDSKFEIEEKEEDAYLLNEIDYTKWICLTSTGFRYI